MQNQKMLYRIVANNGPVTSPCRTHTEAQIRVGELATRRTLPHGLFMQVSTNDGRTWCRANSRDGGAL